MFGLHFVDHDSNRLRRGGHDKAHRIGQRLAQTALVLGRIALQDMQFDSWHSELPLKLYYL